MKKQVKQHYWSAEEIVAAVNRFVQQNKRLPVARELNARNGLPVHRTFERKMGMTWGRYTKLHYPELAELNEQRHQQCVLDIRFEMSQWTEEKLILAVENFAQQNGRLPLSQEYTAENGLPSYTTFCKIAEQAMVGYLENHLSEYICQSDVLREDDAELCQAEGLSLGMNLTL